MKCSASPSSWARSRLRDEPRERLAELVRAELPAAALVERHADIVGKGVDAEADMHLSDGDDRAMLSVLDEEELVAPRGLAQRLAQLLQQFDSARDGQRRHPAFEEASRIIHRLEQSRRDVGLLDARLPERAAFDGSDLVSTGSRLPACRRSRR